ncbi:hypothetical protein HUG20_09215 [Salicibibacter cibi]|uniref:Uncharacterized protein n=1 Tax=Salicibibacter cibi TaxID=2743001 RepID=A0A7T6ZB72_9BACI|nr:hypothetical protein [Salicibibacter cibi]QQK80050.1 hypothetical protein HUG20_09215 [Salicibibacter cibi]
MKETQKEVNVQIHEYVTHANKVEKEETVDHSKHHHHDHHWLLSQRRFQKK